MSESLIHYVVVPFTKGLVTVLLLALAAGVLTWIERRLLGRLQIRKGPNRVGPQGFFQWIADVVKLVFKEDVVPSRAEKLLHLLGPLLDPGHVPPNCPRSTEPSAASGMCACTFPPSIDHCMVSGS